MHLVLVHEYLHQVEQAFEEIAGESYLASPDAEDLHTVLQHNARGSEIDWRMLSPLMGEWIPR